MKFESRELKPYMETVDPAELKIGEVYFTVSYVDDQLLLPIMLSLVYLGTDLQGEVSGVHYFQDLDSYTEGVRFGDEQSEGPGSIHFGDIVKGIQRFDQALAALMSCSLRRAEQGLA